ncbi:ABC transporter substrate-binding protein [Halorussus sp. AFM4]|uniref:ABC transporter substrate-binding protein n=1 Tax=Halorussus sp. AFM4 TaxID=3421651 RepID=UPI003EBC132F
MPSPSDRDGSNRGESTTNRRRFLRATGATGALATTALAGCTSRFVGGGGSSSPTEDKPLKIGVYGGVFKEVLDEALVKPFTENTDVPATSKPQSVGDAMVKLKQSVDADKAPVDVLVVAPDARIHGQRMGTWLNYSPDEISRLDGVIDDQVTRNDDGDIVGVGAFGWFLNLTSNTNVLDSPLTSWRDLWNSKYKDQLAANRLVGDGFLLDIAAHTFDEFDGRKSLQTKADIKKVMQKVAEINPQISLWWAQEAEAQQPLKEGNIGATQMYNDVSLVMKDKGAPVETRFPKEGGLLNFGSWCIVKSTDYPDAAKQFVDYAVRPDVQTKITKKLYSAPTIEQSKLDISDELYEKVYGPGPDAAIRPYNELYVEREKWITEQWKQTVLS